MKIKFPYSPNITRDTISAIFYKHFPQFEQVCPWLTNNKNILGLKKSSVNVVTVTIRHKPNEDETILQVAPNMMPTAFLYAGILVNFFVRGDFPQCVYEAIQSEIPSLQDGTFNLKPLPNLEESIRKSKRGVKAVLYTCLLLIVASFVFILFAL